MKNQIKPLPNGDFQVVPLDDPGFLAFTKNRNRCYCYNCNRDRRNEDGIPVVMTQMIVCPECGNKRCPHSTDHRNACTNSNEPNQPSVHGNRY